MDLSIIAILKFFLVSILVCVPFVVLWAGVRTVNRDFREDSEEDSSSLPPQAAAPEVSPKKEWPSTREEWATKRKAEAQASRASKKEFHQVNVEPLVKETLKHVERIIKEKKEVIAEAEEAVIQKPAPNLSKLWASMDKAAAKERAAKRKAKATQKPRPRKKVTEEPEGSSAPQKVITNSTGFERSIDVKSWVLETAIGTCESCDQPAPFMTKGQDYLEVHHVQPLGNGGSDTIQNAVAICPNCHRAFHHSDDREAMKDRLYKRVKRLVRE